jgi:hypothetical protein
MKYYISIFILFFCFVIAYSQPKIEIVGGNEKNWGKVSPKDSPLKTTILIKNSGNQPLNLSKVKPGCGCTTAPVKKDVLSPGETTDIDVTFNVSGNTGPVTKTIAIESNDPNNPNITYYLKAEVIRPLQILPSSYMTFNTLQVGLEGEAKVRIKNNSNENVTLLGVETDPKEMKTNLNGKKTLKPQEEFEIVAKVVPTKAGAINTRISVKTNHPDFPVLDIFGYGRVAESPIFNNK